MTFLTLLGFTFVFSCALAAYGPVKTVFGFWAGLGAGVLGGAAGIAIQWPLWYMMSRRDHARRSKFREKYRHIYRVVKVPSDCRNIEKPNGAEIRVGDYGWEARPARNNGLIYLHGLTKEWNVVWWAGFSPDEIEEVGPKPVSQYDWPQFLHKKTPCPFPVERPEHCTAMGLPNGSP